MASFWYLSISLGAKVTDGNFFHNVSRFDIKCAFPRHFGTDRWPSACDKAAYYRKYHRSGSPLLYNSGSTRGAEILIPHFHDKRGNKSPKRQP